MEIINICSSSFFILFLLFFFTFTSCLQFDMTALGTNYNNNNFSSSLRQLEKSILVSNDNKYHLMTVPICFGEPRQCFKLIYDTGLMYVVISGNPKAKFTKVYDYSKSSTFRNIIGKNLVSFPYGTGSISAREATDFVLLPQQPTPLYSVNFLVAFETIGEYSFDGVLGLGGFYPNKQSGLEIDDRFSFVNYLKFNKLIDDRIFAHQYIDRTTGKFYIGELPYKRDEYKQCSSMFFFDPLIYKWHCDLNEISFEDGEKISLSSNFAAFSTGGANVIAPGNEGNEILKYILSISGEKCVVNSADEGVKKLICDENFSTSKVPNLHFKFVEGNLDITFFNEDMFRLIELNGKRKLLFKITVLEKTTEWNLGEPILKNYDMFFDYETEIVGFKENPNFIGESWTGVIILSVVLLVLMIIFGYLFANRKRLIIKYFKSKNIEKIDDPNTFEEGHQLGDIE